MSANTKPLHKWESTSEEGIFQCKSCPCMKRVQGVHCRTYKARPSADWRRETPPCKGVKFVDQRAKTCTSAPPLKSDNVPPALKT